MSIGRLPLRNIVGRSLVMAAAIATSLLSFTGHGARADETLKLVTHMAVPMPSLVSFGISFDEPVLDVYLLADRTAQSLDVFDANQLKPMFHVSGFVGIAKGCATGNVSDCSGPNGVAVTLHQYAWVGDGDSTVKVVDLATTKIIDTISTGGKFRAGKLAVDPRHNIIAIANDADDPPLLTFISTATRKVLGQLRFPSATNGLEQPVWDLRSGHFYLAVPELNHDTGKGAIAEVSPISEKVLNYLPVPCEPAGLALGPGSQALIGCSDGPVRVIDLTNGDILATFATAANAGEVWYNPGDNHYYVAAGSDPSGPVLGMINATTLTADNGVQSVVGNHSVAADPLRNHVFLPSIADPKDDNCLQGCIKVYLPGQADANDPGLPVDFTKTADR